MIVEEKRVQHTEFSQLKGGQCFRFASHTSYHGVFMKVVDCSGKSIGAKLSNGVAMESIRGSCPVIPVNIIAREE